MRKKRYPIIIIWAAMLAACNYDFDVAGTGEADMQAMEPTLAEAGTQECEAADKVECTTFNNMVEIRFEGDTAYVACPNPTCCQITQRGARLSITTLKKTHYIVTGRSESGQLRLYGEKRTHVTLRDVHITNPTGAVLNIQSKKRHFITLEGTSALQDGTAYSTTEGEKEKAVVYSRGQLIFDGTGTLRITALGGDAINTGQYLRFRPGPAIDIRAQGDKGTVSKGNTYIDGGRLSVEVLSDEGKGIKAKDSLFVSGGYVSVRCYGRKNEGMESKKSMYIRGGYIDVVATDDALNSGWDNELVISGGTIYAASSGNDGIDSNGTITITGGVVFAYTTAWRERGLDCDDRPFSIMGGTVVSFGHIYSFPTPSLCTQPYALIDCTGAQGSRLSLSPEGSNDCLLSVALPGDYHPLRMIVSSPDLRIGQCYDLTTGGTLTAATTLHELRLGGVLQGQRLVSVVSLSGVENYVKR